MCCELVSQVHPHVLLEKPPGVPHLLAFSYIVLSVPPLFFLEFSGLIRLCRLHRTKIVLARQVDIIHAHHPADLHRITALDQLRCTHRPLHLQRRDRETQWKELLKVRRCRRWRQKRTRQPSPHKSHHLGHRHQQPMSTTLGPDLQE